ncbi:MAG: hypothetical protein ABL973_13540 [Micropepsaceae bacterium]
MRCLFVAGLSLTLLGAAQAPASEPTPRPELYDLSTPSPQVRAFLADINATYLVPHHTSFGRLDFFQIAKLIGYAVGEAATNPGPVDVFDAKFKRELENWITGFAAESMIPTEAVKAWRLIEEGSRGFYDDEMEGKFGHRPPGVTASAAPVSAVAWFDALSPADKEGFLLRGARGDLKNDDGTPYSVSQFRVLARLMDLEMETRGYSQSQRSASVRTLVEEGSVGRVR